MANDTNKKGRPAHSGFEVEPVNPGKPLPKGTKIKHNSDGTISIVPPKKK